MTGRERVQNQMAPESYDAMATETVDELFREMGIGADELRSGCLFILTPGRPEIELPGGSVEYERLPPSSSSDSDESYEVQLDKLAQFLRNSLAVPSVDSLEAAFEQCVDFQQRLDLFRSLQSQQAANRSQSSLEHQKWVEDQVVRICPHARCYRNREDLISAVAICLAEGDTGIEASFGQFGVWWLFGTRL